ncbi:vWA domain-containing protein [Corynebacterium hadale]|uniref:vWA domain-containing protein n=1 Tax=Corynebacterium hadale TaxID=2026255 RepID=UPI0010546DEE|nr:vWA domain-containing protein [Corynebacterium hadale]
MRHTTARVRVNRSVRALFAAVLVMAIGVAPAGAAEPTADQSAPDSVSAEQPALDAGADSVAVDADATASADADVAGGAADSPAESSPAESSAAAQPNGTSTFGPDPLVPAAITQDGITVERDGDVDTIHVHDSEGELWQWGWKASQENIFALTRKGEVTEVLSVTADGRKLDRKKFGWVNTKDGAFIGFDLNALHTIPPVDVTIKVKTKTKGDYDIAESEDIPTSQEFAKTGYDPKEELDPEVEAQLRAAPEGSIPHHPGMLDQKLSLSKITASPFGGNRRLTFTVNETGEWQMTRVRVSVACDSRASALGETVGITVDRNGQNIIPRNTEGMPFATHNRNEFSNPCDREFHRVKDPSSGAWHFKGSTDIKFQGGDTIMLDIPGPDRSDYKVEMWAQRPKLDPTKDPKTVAQDPTKDFSVTGEGVVMSPSQTIGGNPYETTSKFRQDTNFERAVVRVAAPNSVLALEQYRFTVDKIEDGVTLQRNVIRATPDFVEFEIYPVKDGAPVESALIPQGATLKFTSAFGDNPELINADVTVIGKPKVGEDWDGKISPPDGADWVHPRVPNPPMPKKCGLRVAIVADQSTSLKYADGDAFTQSREAAKAMVKALSGAPATQVGIYTFARTSPSSGEAGVGETGGPVDINSADGKINPRITKAIDGWTSKYAQSTTNWEAGLEKVKKGNYDVVYFITDGMPTWFNGTKEDISIKNSGAFVQEGALNAAIDAANDLKASGTRVVPLMVDLQLKAGNIVTQDYVLKNLKSWPEGGTKVPGTYFTTNTGQAPDSALYKLKPGETDDTLVNVEQALSKDGAFNVYRVDENGKQTTITADQGEWTFGARDVKTMGEDISGEGDTIRVKSYSLLAAQLEEIGKQLTLNCSKIVIKKNIVDESGNVTTEGASGWEFTASAAQKALVTGGQETAEFSNSQQTAKDTGAWWNVASDKPVTINVEETQKEGFEYRGVTCKQDGKEAALPTRKFGDTGFQVEVSPQDGKPVSVTCEVSNQGNEVPTYGLALKKVDAFNKEAQLDGAEFTLSWGDSEGERLTIAQGEDKKYSTEKILEPGKTYTLVESRSPLVGDGVSGERYSLLVSPVRFKIDVEGGKPVAKFAQGDQWVTDASTSGVWAERPDNADTSTVFLGVANVRQGNLPKTGGHGLQTPLAVSTVLMLFGAALARRRAVQV